MTPPLDAAALDALAKILDGATKERWQWWTSNSHTRLGTVDKDGNIAYGYSLRDGADHINISEENMAAIVAIMNNRDALVSMARRALALEAALIEVQHFAQPTRRTGFALDTIRRIVNRVLPPVREVKGQTP